MQFHLNGFRTGDPGVSDPIVDTAISGDALPSEVDVLIVGCGPAGLTLAAQLSAFPSINVAIIDQKPGPLELGQADGIACRTLEMFKAFGFAEKVLKEAYWVNETSFWKPDDSDHEKIIRHGRVLDVEDGLSEMPHVILNQARVHDFYLDVMRRSPRRLEPHYSRQMVEVSIDAAQQAGTHPVTVTIDRGDGEREIVRARYVVGCDGARSAVRRSLGRELRGDSANQAWGVMDVLAVTDFPDVRLKALIQSASEGSILLIPREGGYLIRVYVELDKLAPNERVASRSIGVEHLIGAAQRILKPYSFEVKEVAWWSVYEIGQRLCDKFDDVPDEEMATRLPRVFIVGDACHTHSPKAGQGMNVSMQDAFNLGWKLAAVLEGRVPAQLLHSYSAERQSVAKELISFDREWAKMLSSPLKTIEYPEGVDPAEVQEYFVRFGRYTAGTATRYEPSTLIGEPKHQHLAEGFPIGMRFHSAPVIRLADAKPMQLGHIARADGRWRVYAFADEGDNAAPGSLLAGLCDFLTSKKSPLVKFAPEDADIDSFIDLRVVFQQPHRELAIETMPKLLLPAKGRLGLRDYEKMFCPASGGSENIFEMRSINRKQGCMVVVRPDQYVAHVLPLDAYSELTAFFDGFMVVTAQSPSSVADLVA
ncbi:phenol 2-monooxygenase [Rhizobium petrolearium]|uniref:FAD-binding monooxygenase n=2 Tax=Neorhizobium TaxID=1525371 RepID=A0ABV0MD02_9HYPH|nr:FAD-binding monooxygenase [Neorhizobium petrolearium]MBP1848425.1 phenol 2-monooxygenase [Neorhizobium petrolearium]MCC2614484.1 FAD-binding monooxygenase [Neorhizobium petrolearium]WGI72246.1 FAD-binding monooxygenase [Neorhizobium petrolearium]